MNNWRAMKDHPGTGILIWLLHKPNAIDLPTVIQTRLCRFDSWNNTFRIVDNGADIVIPIAWCECVIPVRPSKEDLAKLSYWCKINE